MMITSLASCMSVSYRIVSAPAVSSALLACTLQLGLAASLTHCALCIQSLLLLLLLLPPPLLPLLLLRRGAWPPPPCMHAVRSSTLATVRSSPTGVT